MKDLTEIEKAWLSAVIDGEGSITFNRTKRGVWRVILCVGNTSLAFLNKVQEIVGAGTIAPKTRAKEHWTPAFQWTLTGRRRCSEILRQLLPFLIIKQEKAKRVILLDDFRRQKSRKGTGQGLRFGIFEQSLIQGNETEIKEIQELL